LEQYCYKIYVKTTIIWECENRIHPKNNTLLLEIVDLQGLLTGPPTDLPKRLLLPGERRLPPQTYATAKTAMKGRRNLRHANFILAFANV